MRHIKVREIKTGANLKSITKSLKFPKKSVGATISIDMWTILGSQTEDSIQI